MKGCIMMSTAAKPLSYSRHTPFVLILSLFLGYFDAHAQKKRLWLATIITVHSQGRYVGLLHSVNDSLVSILPGFTRRTLLAAAERNQTFQVPLDAVRKIRVRRVRTAFGYGWEFSRVYIPVLTGALLVFRPHTQGSFLVVNAASAAVGSIVQNALASQTFVPGEGSFRYQIQKYCYYPSFRVPVEAKRRK